MKNKKGDIFQIFFVITILLVVAIVGVICLRLTNGVNSFYEETGILNDTAVGREAITQIETTAPKTTDYAVFLLFLGLNIGVVIAAVRTNFSAAVIFLFIFLMLIAIFFAAGAVNMYQGLAQQPDMLSTSNQLTLTNFIFSKYFPLIISIICALIMLLMWGKSGGDIIT